MNKISILAPCFQGAALNCECGKLWQGEWACEGGMNAFLASNNRRGTAFRYQRGLHVCAMCKRMALAVNLGGTAG